MDGIEAAVNGLAAEHPDIAVMLLFSAMFAAFAVRRFHWEE
jgi:hypothetical protein